MKDLLTQAVALLDQAMEDSPSRELADITNSLTDYLDTLWTAPLNALT